MKTKAGLLPGLLVCLALGFPSRGTATADDWKYLAVSPRGDRFFYDSASVIPLSGGVIEVWIKKIGSNGSLSRIRSEINCSFKIIRDKQVITDAPGKGKYSHDIDKTWRAMELDPVMLELFKVFCK